METAGSTTKWIDTKKKMRMNKKNNKKSQESIYAFLPSPITDLTDNTSFTRFFSSILNASVNCRENKVLQKRFYEQSRSLQSTQLRFTKQKGGLTNALLNMHFQSSETKNQRSWEDYITVPLLTVTSDLNDWAMFARERKKSYHTTH